MHTLPIERSRDVAVALTRFEAEIDAWIGDAMAANAGEPCTDVHDQGTYTTAWAAFLAGTPCHPAIAFVKGLRDRIAAHFTGKGLWRHGYWTMHEAHHGTEHFELFLGALHALDPTDGATIAQIEDACEHLGNWSPDVPSWFDEERGLFRSMWFGADGVKDEGGPNVPDHLRCVNLALLAHAATGRGRFLEFARSYAERWARAIVEGTLIPVGLDASGGVADFDEATRARYKGIVGQASAMRAVGLAGGVERAENYLASGVVGSFLRLFAATGDGVFLSAGERLLDVLATQTADPDAGAAVADLMLHHRITGSDRYIGGLRSAGAGFTPGRVRVLGIEPIIARTARPVGIGKRKDMPAWFEDGERRRHSPVLLAAMAELTRDEAIACEALDVGRVYLALARRVYDHGRAHGCSARSISAVARGHGRDNHVGVVTGVYDPLARVFGG